MRGYKEYKRKISLKISYKHARVRVYDVVVGSRDNSGSTNTQYFMQLTTDVNACARVCQFVGTI